MKKKRMFKCSKCGAVVEAVADFGCPAGGFICCGVPMDEMTEKTADGKGEKHVPFPASAEHGGTHVKVGETMEHPMTPDHRIVWIEIENGDYINRKYLRPDGKPEADFHVSLKPGMIVREFCNIHGLWKYEVK